MANGFNRGRYLLPTINYIEKRVMILDSQLNSNTDNWYTVYFIASETLDIKDLISDMERLRLTNDEKVFFKNTKQKLDEMYKVAKKIITPKE